MNDKIIIRFDASSALGMGHAVRMCEFKKQLNQHNIDVVFCVRLDDMCQLYMKKQNCIFYKIPSDMSDIQEGAYIAGLIEKLCISLLILDTLDNAKDYISILRKGKVPIISFDDQIYDNNVDVRINGLAPINHTIVDRTYYYGDDYVLLNRAICEYARFNKEIKQEARKVMLSFGGSDPNDIILYALDELSLIKGLDITCILGSAYLHKDKVLDKIKESTAKINVVLDCKNMAEQLYQADVCIISAGITLFEAFAIGCPCIVICQVPHQEITATRLQNQGLLINLGNFIKLKDGDLSNAFIQVQEDVAWRSMSAQINKKAVDCKGDERILEIVKANIRRVHSE